MIPIFRKIRKKMADDNRPLKYMRYAIGEIVLVVIGILIALQINNWNEKRKVNIDEQNALLNLKKDFEYNKIIIDSLIKSNLSKLNSLCKKRYSFCLAINLLFISSICL